MHFARQPVCDTLLAHLDAVPVLLGDRLRCRTRQDHLPVARGKHGYCTNGHPRCRGNTPPRHASCRVTFNWSTPCHSQPARARPPTAHAPVQEGVLCVHDLVEGAAAGEVQVGAPAGVGSGGTGHQGLCALPTAAKMQPVHHNGGSRRALLLIQGVCSPVAQNK